jgi:hypothetical protein
MSKTKGEKWLDIGMGWLVQYEYEPHWLDFTAYEVIATSENGTVKEYRDKTDPKGVEFTEDLAKAESIGGFVKWDGCCEIKLPDQPHFCGRRDVADFARVLTELHALCLLLPNVDRDCAGYKDSSDE